MSHGIFRAVLRGLALALLAVVASVVAEPALAQADAQAQDQDGKVFKDWRIRCLNLDPEGTRKGCLAEHLVVNQENQKPILAIRAHYSTPDGSPVAVINVPLFVRLPPGLRVQVDGGPTVTVPFYVCALDGCRARVPLAPDLLAAFKKGLGGKIVFQTPRNQEVTTPFSLRGFTAGLAAVK